MAAAAAGSPATPGGGGATPGTGSQEEEEHEVVRVRVKVSDLAGRVKGHGRSQVRVGNLVTSQERQKLQSEGMLTPLHHPEGGICQ